jgi:hypothetical protein
MARTWHEAHMGEHAKGPRFVSVYHHCVSWLAVQDERHEAIVARVRVLHHTVVAADHQRVTSGFWFRSDLHLRDLLGLVLAAAR